MRSVINPICVAVIILLCSSGQLTAQTQDSSAHSSTSNHWTVGSDFSMSLHSVGHSLTSPLRWEKADLPWIGVFVGGTVTAFLLDNEVRSVMLKNKSNFSDRVEQIGYSYGAPQYAGAASVACYISGAVVDNTWLRETGLMMTEMVVTAGIIQFPIKIMAGRSRPETNEGSNKFKPFKGIAQERGSFFSGHALIAFGLSTVLARRINHPAASIALYCVAATTPYARMYGDKHWVSDVFIGSALGIFIGNTIVNWHNENSSDQAQLMLIPTSDGISFSLHF